MLTMGSDVRRRSIMVEQPRELKRDRGASRSFGSAKLAFPDARRSVHGPRARREQDSVSRGCGH